MIIKHNKLVRDNIINIIKSSNKKCTYTVLSDEDYLKQLYIKLREEHNEFDEEYSIAELADMQEVIEAILEARKISESEFNAIKEAKNAKNGRFKNKLYLIEVEENE